MVKLGSLPLSKRFVAQRSFPMHDTTTIHKPQIATHLPHLCTARCTLVDEGNEIQVQHGLRYRVLIALHICSISRCVFACCATVSTSRLHINNHITLHTPQKTTPDVTFCNNCIWFPTGLKCTKADGTHGYFVS